jgi:hypothetical protein
MKQQREKFEEWCSSMGLSTLRDEIGWYRAMSTSQCWHAWETGVNGVLRDLQQSMLDSGSGASFTATEDRK